MCLVGGKNHDFQNTIVFWIEESKVVLSCTCKNKMKKLASRLAKLAEINQIELGKWSRHIIYDFVSGLCNDISDQNENRKN